MDSLVSQSFLFFWLHTRKLVVNTVGDIQLCTLFELFVNLTLKIFVLYWDGIIVVTPVWPLLIFIFFPFNTVVKLHNLISVNRTVHGEHAWLVWISKFTVDLNSPHGGYPRTSHSWQQRTLCEIFESHSCPGVLRGKLRQSEFLWNFKINVIKARANWP